MLQTTLLKFIFELTFQVQRGEVGFQVTGDRWQVIGDRWQVTGDRWQVFSPSIFFFFLILVLLSAHIETLIVSCRMDFSYFILFLLYFLCLSFVFLVSFLSVTNNFLGFYLFFLDFSWFLVVEVDGLLKEDFFKTNNNWMK